MKELIKEKINQAQQYAGFCKKLYYVHAWLSFLIFLIIYNMSAMKSQGNEVEFMAWHIIR